MDPSHLTKYTILPNQHSVFGQHRPASETPLKWHFAGGPIVVRFVYQDIGFPRNTDMDPSHLTKYTILPNQHSVFGQHRPASETPLKWHFAGGPIVVRFVDQDIGFHRKTDVDPSHLTNLKCYLTSTQCPGMIGQPVIRHYNGISLAAL